MCIGGIMERVHACVHIHVKCVHFYPWLYCKVCAYIYSVRCVHACIKCEQCACILWNVCTLVQVFKLHSVTCSFVSNAVLQSVCMHIRSVLCMHVNGYYECVHTCVSIQCKMCMFLPTAVL